MFRSRATIGQAVMRRYIACLYFRQGRKQADQIAEEETEGQLTSLYTPSRWTKTWLYRSLIAKPSHLGCHRPERKAIRTYCSDVSVIRVIRTRVIQLFLNDREYCEKCLVCNRKQVDEINRLTG